MNILVLGAGGMAGHVTTIYLKEKGHNVVGFSKTPLSYCQNIIGNALNKDDLKNAINLYSFDAVINCIGLLNKEVDKNISDAIYLNSYLPNFLSESLKNKKTKLIHLSTDCVFSGNSGYYSENSFRDSDTLYGRTKALGEINDEKNLTIRTSIIGPDRKKNGIGLLNWFLNQNNTVEGFTSAIWTGVSTITLAQAFEMALEQNICGIYHLVNNETISKFELLKLFNLYLRKTPINILPNESIDVDKSLLNNRNDFHFTVPAYEKMIQDTKMWILDHKELYPHYF